MRAFDWLVVALYIGWVTSMATLMLSSNPAARIESSYELIGKSGC